MEKEKVRDVINALYQGAGIKKGSLAKSTRKWRRYYRKVPAAPFELWYTELVFRGKKDTTFSNEDTAFKVRWHQDFDFEYFLASASAR